VYVKENLDLIERAEERVLSALSRDGKDPQTTVRKSLTEFLYTETQRRPMVMPVVIET
jgi:mRNA degradation ribonuclease J1/J2